LQLDDLSTQIHPIHAVNNAHFALAYKSERLSTDQIQFQISVQNKLKLLFELTIQERKTETNKKKRDVDYIKERTKETET